MDLPHLPPRPDTLSVPRWLPWVIAGALVLYFAVAAVTGTLLLRGNDSATVRSLARWLPIPVAKVGGQLVWAREYLDYRTFIETFVSRSNEAGEAIAPETPIGQQVINLLVSNTTIERAASDGGISVTAADVDAAFNELLVARSGEASREVSEQELEQILHELYGSSQERLRDLIRIRLLEDKVRNELLQQVHFRHILIQDEGRAKEVLQRLKDSGNFEELAREFSEHVESRDAGGDVGFVPRGTQLAQLEDVIFTHGPGLIGELVKSDFGYHLIEILEVKGTVQQSFDAWRADAERRYLSTVYLRPST